MSITKSLYFAVLLLILVSWACDSSPKTTPLDKQSPQILDAIHLPAPHSLFRAADSLKYLGQYAKASALFESLLEDGEKHSSKENEYLRNQYCYTLLKDYHFEKAASLLENTDQASTEADVNQADWHLNHGLYFLEKGNGDDASYHLTQAEQLYTQFYGRYHKKRFETLLALARQYYNDIRLDSLEICLQEADLLAAKDTTHLFDRPQLFLLKGLAEQYGKGHEEALLLIDLAIEEAKQANHSPIFLATCYAERSQMLRKIDKTEVAREALEKALVLWSSTTQYAQGLLNIYEKLALQAIKEKDSTSFFQVIENIRSEYTEFPDALRHPDCLLAYYSYHDGNLIRATRLYRQLLAKYANASENNRHFFDEAYFVLSEAYRKRGMLDSAIYFNQLSIQQLIGDQPQVVRAIAPGGSLEDITPDYRHTLTVFLSKRPICQYLSFLENPDRNSDSLQQAINSFLRLDSLFFSYSNIRSEDQLLEFAEEHFQFTYDYAIEACFAAFKLWQDPAYLEYGHQFAERVKYAGMARGIFRRQFRAGLPNTLGQKLLALELEIDELKRQRAEELERLKDVINRNIYSLEKQRRSLLDSIHRWYPDLPTLGSDSQISSLAALQLQAQNTILQYHISSNKVNCIVIKKDAISLRQWPYQEDLDTVAERYLKVLSKKSNSHRKTAFAEFTQLSHLLYQQLIAPVVTELDDTENLLICPDANFPQIPYESLISHPAEHPGTDYASLPFIIRDWNIHYTHSLQSGIQMSDYRIATHPAILGYAFSDAAATVPETVRGDKALQLDPLPGTALELNAINASFDQNQNTITLRYGTDADLEQLRNDLQRKYNIIHLGLHANSSSGNRWNNQIFFANASADSADVLYSTELEYYSLTGTLVVLSACNTATGTELAAEGIYSLARSCLIAGAQEVIASLWAIPDQAVSQVMVNFYKRLSKTGQASASLHQAKLQYLEEVATAQKAFPGYWAGLVSFH